jgi:hypothetical protein
MIIDGPTKNPYGWALQRSTDAPVVHRLPAEIPGVNVQNPVNDAGFQSHPGGPRLSGATASRAAMQHHHRQHMNGLGTYDPATVHRIGAPIFYPQPIYGPPHRIQGGGAPRSLRGLRAVPIFSGGKGIKPITSQPPTGRPVVVNPTTSAGTPPPGVAPNVPYYPPTYAGGTTPVVISGGGSSGGGPSSQGAGLPCCPSNIQGWYCFETECQNPTTGALCNSECGGTSTEASQTYWCVDPGTGYSYPCNQPDPYSAYAYDTLPVGSATSEVSTLCTDPGTGLQYPCNETDPYAATAAVAAAQPSWFTDPNQEIISGIPNWMLAIGAVGAAYYFTGKKKK